MPNEYITFKVAGSQAVAKPDGVAIKLVLPDGKAIALEVDQQAIDALRRNLTDAETILKRMQRPGKPQ